jgi:formylglycine-generating enzyme required for sulfatase activity
MLTEREHTASRLPKDEVYRLPTEAEWEYACRAGSRTAYWFGSNPADLDRYEWAGEALKKRPYAHEVAEKVPNGWGLYDMHGNIAEWCYDWWGEYASGEVSDPAVSSRTCFYRVTRGGSWITEASHCRSAARFMVPHEQASRYTGFRIVRGRPVPVPPKNSAGDGDNGSEAEDGHESAE